jgi:hypothetical protein
VTHQLLQTAGQMKRRKRRVGVRKEEKKTILPDSDILMSIMCWDHWSKNNVINDFTHLVYNLTEIDLCHKPRPKRAGLNSGSPGKYWHWRRIRIFATVK